MAQAPGRRADAGASAPGRSRAGRGDGGLYRDLNREWVVAYLAAGAAGLAVVLASIGLYGVLSFLVVSRTREIGVRMALGARRVQVTGLVLRQSAILTGAGIVGGIAAAMALTRYLRGLLFEVDPLDPATFIGVALVFAAVALLSAYLPARRALRVDPLAALRSE